VLRHLLCKIRSMEITEFDSGFCSAAPSDDISALSGVLVALRELGVKESVLKELSLEVARVGKELPKHWSELLRFAAGSKPIVPGQKLISDYSKFHTIMKPSRSKGLRNFDAEKNIIPFIIKSNKVSSICVNWDSKEMLVGSEKIIFANSGDVKTDNNKCLATLGFERGVSVPGVVRYACAAYHLGRHALPKSLLDTISGISPEVSRLVEYAVKAGQVFAAKCVGDVELANSGSQYVEMRSILAASPSYKTFLHWVQSPNYVAADILGSEEYPTTHMGNAIRHFLDVNVTHRTAALWNLVDALKQTRSNHENHSKVTYEGGPNFMGTLKKQMVPLMRMGVTFGPDDGGKDKNVIVLGAGSDNITNYVSTADCFDIKSHARCGYINVLALEDAFVTKVREKNIPVFSDICLAETDAERLIRMSGRPMGEKVKATKFDCTFPVARILVERFDDVCCKLFFCNLRKIDLEDLVSLSQGREIQVFPGGRPHNGEGYVRFIRNSKAYPVGIDHYRQLFHYYARVAAAVSVQRLCLETVQNYVPIHQFLYPYGCDLTVKGDKAIWRPFAKPKVTTAHTIGGSELDIDDVSTAGMLAGLTEVAFKIELPEEDKKSKKPGPHAGMLKPLPSQGSSSSSSSKDAPSPPSVVNPSLGGLVIEAPEAYDDDEGAPASVLDDVDDFESKG